MNDEEMDYTTAQGARLREIGEIKTDNAYKEVQRIAREVRVTMVGEEKDVLARIAFHSKIMIELKDQHNAIALPFNQLIGIARAMLNNYATKPKAVEPDAEPETETDEE